MLKTKVRIVNPLGLHARAAASLVRLAGTFQSDIRIKRTDNAVVADAKSILSVLTLAASKGVLLDLEIEGIDEELAATEIEKLFIKGFGEI